MKFVANLNLKGHQFFFTHPVHYRVSQKKVGRFLKSKGRNHSIVIKCVLLCLWEFKRIVYMNGGSILIVII